MSDQSAHGSDREEQLVLLSIEIMAATVRMKAISDCLDVIYRAQHSTHPFDSQEWMLDYLYEQTAKLYEMEQAKVSKLRKA
jgi:hypothetical protein